MPDLHSPYMTVEVVTPGPCNGVWIVRNKKSGDGLGRIEWYGPWRRYLFEASTFGDFSADCLDAISAFLKAANTEARAATPPRAPRPFHCRPPQRATKAASADLFADGPGAAQGGGHA